MSQEVKIGQTWCGKWSNKEVEIYDIYTDHNLGGRMICYSDYDDDSNHHMSIEDFLQRFNLLEDVEEKKENNMEFVKVDEVKVGQVWGCFDERTMNKVDEPSEVMDIVDGKAIFQDGTTGDLKQMISENGIFKEYMYICIKDAPKKDNREDNSHDFSDILGSIGQMLAEKDKRYGNSALKPLDIFAKHHSYGARLDEKLARVKNSGELRKNDVADIIGGLVLICRDNEWTDFSDQID